MNFPLLDGELQDILLEVLSKSVMDSIKSDSFNDTEKKILSAFLKGIERDTDPIVFYTKQGMKLFPGEKIRTIKFVREQTNCGLKEAKECADYLMGSSY